MTEKEKAKAYDEALKKASAAHKDDDRHIKATLERIFPELKESEDEKMINFIINELACLRATDEKGSDRYEELTNAIAWLEKQGKEEYALKSFKDEDVRKFMQYIEKQAKAYEFNLPNRSYDIYAFAKDLLAWFEKQGEKASLQTNECAWLYLVSDVLTWKDGIGQYLDDPKVQEFAKRLCSEYSQKLYNPSNAVKNEQKSADKIEPRFNVGDWITIDKPCQIINIHDNGNYIVQYCDDENTYELSKNFCESYFHFWTIQDVKDGDVLVNGSNIFIFHFINNRRLMGYCHMNMDDGNLYNDIGRNECFCTIDAPVTPATKEQRDALMKAINDDGYEWDGEKKELKKKIIMMVQEKIKKKAEEFGILAPEFLKGADFALNNQWIDCNDKMPYEYPELLLDRDNTVPVLTKTERLGYLVQFMYYIETRQSWTFSEGGGVTHWMPLPDLPKE